MKTDAELDEEMLTLNFPTMEQVILFECYGSRIFDYFSPESWIGKIKIYLITSKIQAKHARIERLKQEIRRDMMDL